MKKKILIIILILLIVIVVIPKPYTVSSSSSEVETHKPCGMGGTAETGFCIGIIYPISTSHQFNGTLRDLPQYNENGEIMTIQNAPKVRCTSTTSGLGCFGHKVIRGMS
jgi:hypothetical protein